MRMHEPLTKLDYFWIVVIFTALVAIWIGVIYGVIYAAGTILGL